LAAGIADMESAAMTAVVLAVVVSQILIFAGTAISYITGMAGSKDPPFLMSKVFAVIKKIRTNVCCTERTKSVRTLAKSKFRERGCTNTLAERARMGTFEAAVEPGPQYHTSICGSSEHSPW